MQLGKELQLGWISPLLELITNRDTSTGCHSINVAGYVGILAHEMVHLGMGSRLMGLTISEFSSCAQTHDIGKMGIPDMILRKRGSLTNREMDAVKQHTILGSEMLSKPMKDRSQRQQTCACQMARSHHEWWNGMGYPDCLAKENIPFSARLLAFADVYDALTSKRCYKEAYSHERTVEVIRKNREIQFDPLLTELFLSVQTQFEWFLCNMSIH